MAEILFNAGFTLHPRPLFLYVRCHTRYASSLYFGAEDPWLGPTRWWLQDQEHLLALFEVVQN